VRSPLSLLVVAAGVALCGGCSYREERRGEDRFLRRPMPLVAGATTTREVVEELGAPDRLWTAGDALYFGYRYYERTSRALTLRYYLDLFKHVRAEEVDTFLLLVFDRDDRLRYVAAPPGSRESTHGSEAPE
jgi:hypothetical protein